MLKQASVQSISAKTLAVAQREHTRKEVQRTNHFTPTFFVVEVAQREYTRTEVQLQGLTRIFGGRMGCTARIYENRSATTYATIPVTPLESFAQREHTRKEVQHSLLYLIGIYYSCCTARIYENRSATIVARIGLFCVMRLHSANIREQKCNFPGK